MPKILRWDRQAIAEYQQKLITSFAETTKKMETSKSAIKIGSLVHVRDLNKSIFAKETQRRFSQQVFMVVDRKNSFPFCYRLFPDVYKQSRFFYAEELFLLPPSYRLKKNLPAAIERILNKKELRNKTFYHCSMIGEDKKVWLTREDILNRFILIQNKLSREVLSSIN